MSAEAWAKYLADAEAEYLAEKKAGFVRRSTAMRFYTAQQYYNLAVAPHILRRSGVRVWLADRLVMLAGLLNPAKPWKR